MKGVKAFQQLSETIGVPRAFINALTPNMQIFLDEFDDIFADYIRVFIKELGVNNSLVQDGLIRFVFK